MTTLAEMLPRVMNEFSLDAEGKKDREISDAFNGLNNSPQKVAKALLEDNGNLTLRIGTANNITEYFKRLTNLDVINLTQLSNSDVENNSSFIKFKQQLKASGHDVELLSTHPSDGVRPWKATSVFLKSVAPYMAVCGAPIEAALWTAVNCTALAVVADMQTSSFDVSAHVKLKIT